jgi:hypothetical protein
VELNPNSSAWPNPEQAPQVARELSRNGLAWAKTLVVCVTRLNRLPVPRDGASDPKKEIQRELFEEILAYGFSQLKMQATATGMPDAEDWVRLVRQECESLRIRMTWRRKGSRPRLSGPARAGDGSSVTKALEKAGEDPTNTKQITREMFEQFCQVTGLSSNVLVGKGGNLAAIIFYIAVHGVWSHYTTLNREQAQELLRAAQQCHEHLDKAVARWLNPYEWPSASGQRLSNMSTTKLLMR